MISVGQKGVMSYVLAIQTIHKEQDTASLQARGNNCLRAIEAALLYERMYNGSITSVTLFTDKVSKGYTPLITIEVKK